MQKIIPIIAGTWEALIAAAAEHCPVIYVEEALYRAQAAAIRQELSGYVISWKKGKKGVFFLLAAGENRFDHTRHEIYDPYSLL